MAYKKNKNIESIPIGVKYVMEYEPVYKAVSVATCGIVMMFMLVVLYTKVLFLILPFVMIYLVALYMCIRQLTEQVLVYKDRVVLKWRYGKEKTVYLDDIEYTAFRTKGNTVMLNMYDTNSEKLMSIPSAYKNAYRFREDMVRYLWNK